MAIPEALLLTFLSYLAPIRAAPASRQGLQNCLALAWHSGTRRVASLRLPRLL